MAIQCPTCHQAFFTQDYIALSPAKEVLQWYRNYLLTTAPIGRKPLHEISRMLSDGEFEGLPDTKSIIPFPGLYSIIVFKQHEEDRYRILTSNLPRLSVLRTDGFEFAPDGTSAGDPNVVRMFLRFPFLPYLLFLAKFPCLLPAPTSLLGVFGAFPSPFR